MGKRLPGSWLATWPQRDWASSAAWPGGSNTQGHIGALDGGGLTVAVLGSGVDVVYPRENRRLYKRIGEEECVISEFP